MTPSPQKLPAILLAAGLSSRMGDFKPLLKLGDKPLIRHVIDALIHSDTIDPILIITGHRASDVESGLPSLPITFIHNPNYRDGEMLSSLRTGIQSLPPNAPSFVLAFADQPAVQSSTIAALSQAFFKNNSSLVIPIYTGKRGHPVVISAKLLPAIHALPREGSLRTVVHQFLSQAVLLEVPDPSILEDLDTPEDFNRQLAKWK